VLNLGHHLGDLLTQLASKTGEGNPMGDSLFFVFARSKPGIQGLPAVELTLAEGTIVQTADSDDNATVSGVRILVAEPG
jgi:hypothetical protein